MASKLLIAAALLLQSTTVAQLNEMERRAEYDKRGYSKFFIAVF